MAGDSWTLRFSPRAVDEALEASRWYEDRSAGLGDRFDETLGKVYDRLESHPYAYQEVDRDLRRAPLKSFSYAVFYRVLDHEHVVEILAVLHMHRDPGIV